MAINKSNDHKNQPLKNFIRGGQVTHHTLAMFWQVLRFLIIASLFAIVMITGTYFFQNTGAYERSVAKSYYFAKITVDFGNDGSGTVAFQRPNGEIVDVAAMELLTNGAVRYVALRVTDKLMTGLKWSLLFSLGMSMVGTLFFVWRGRGLARRKHLQGSQLVTQAELIRAVKKHNAKIQKELRTPVVKIGPLPFPMGDETKGIGFFGAVGVGKTTALNQLIAHVRERGNRAVIYDKTGDFTAAFYNPETDIILNPFDRRSPGWNLFDDVLLPTDLMGIATAYMPDKSRGGDPMWINGARILFSRIGEKCLMNNARTTRALIDTLMKLEDKQMARLLGDTIAAGLVNPQTPKIIGSFRAVLAAWLDPLDMIPHCDSGKGFSIRRWLNDDSGSGFLFLPSNGDLHDTMRPLITAWLEIAVRGILSLPGSRTRRIWTFMDELPSLQEVPSLQPLIAEARQKGSCTVLGIQNYPQLEDIYGQERARALSGNLRIRFIFSTGDGVIAKWGSEQLGEEKVLDYRENLTYGANEIRDSVGLNETPEKDSLVLASDIQDLPDFYAFVRYPQGLPIAKVKFKYKAFPAIAATFELDPGIFKRTTLIYRYEGDEEAPPAQEELALSAGENAATGDVRSGPIVGDNEPRKGPSVRSEPTVDLRDDEVI